jgi:hypothetical protein
MKTVTFAILALCLCSCSSTPMLPLTAAGPQPENPQGIAHDMIAANLRDPASAVYQYEPLVALSYQTGAMDGHKNHAGWVQVVLVNAKNGFGGYTGFEPYKVFFEAGQPAQFLDPGVILEAALNHGSTPY